MHTQGPWEFDGEEWVSDGEGYDIARVGWRDISGDKSEMVANGRLIAAAPDLLEALQAYALADLAAHGEGGGIGGEVVVRALNAVSKALGREL